MDALSLTSVTVTATRLGPDGSNASGRITFKASSDFTNGTTTVNAEPVVGVLSSGALLASSYEALTLYALDDSGTVAVDPPLYYVVLEEIDGEEIQSYGIFISHTNAPSVDLSALQRLEL